MENLNLPFCRLHRTLPLCKFLRQSRNPRPRSQGGGGGHHAPPPSLSSLQNSPVFLGLKPLIPRLLAYNQLSFLVVVAK